MKNIILIIAVTFLLSCNSSADPAVKVSGNCSHGVQLLSETPFSLNISCEGALGNYLGIIFSGKWNKFGNKHWDIGDRFWYEASWGKDVDSYYFDNASNKLFIATSSVYGIGGIYELDLFNKKYALIYPQKVSAINPEESYSIIKHSEGKLTIQTESFEGNISQKELTLSRH